VSEETLLTVDWIVDLDGVCAAEQFFYFPRRDFVAADVGDIFFIPIEHTTKYIQFAHILQARWNAGGGENARGNSASAALLAMA